MNSQERIIQHKLKVLRHAEQIWNVAKTCRYFGIGRASLYRWKAAYEARSFSEWFDEQLRELRDGLDRMDGVWREARIRLTYGLYVGTLRMAGSGNYVLQ